MHPPCGTFKRVLVSPISNKCARALRKHSFRGSIPLLKFCCAPYGTRRCILARGEWYVPMRICCTNEMVQDLVIPLNFCFLFPLLDQKQYLYLKFQALHSLRCEISKWPGDTKFQIEVDVWFRLCIVFHHEDVNAKGNTLPDSGKVLKIFTFGYCAKVIVRQSGQI